MAKEFLVTVPLDRDFVQIMISGPSAEYTESPPILSVEVERPTNAPPEEVAKFGVISTYPLGVYVTIASPTFGVPLSAYAINPIKIAIDSFSPSPEDTEYKVLVLTDKKERINASVEGGSDGEPPAPIIFSATVDSYPCFALNGANKVLPEDAQSTGDITFSLEPGQPFWDYNGYPYGSYLFDYNNSGVYIAAEPASEEDFNSLTSVVQNVECEEVPTPVSPPPSGETSVLLCHGPQLVRHTTASDGSTTNEEVEALSESCGYIPPYVREVPLRMFAYAKNRVSIDGPQGPVPYYPWLDVGTMTARITYTRTRAYPSNPIPPNTYQTNAPVYWHSTFGIEVVGTLPTLDPDVYRVSESGYWSINGFNFGGLFTDYDTIRRGGGERIIIDEALVGQVDPPPENYLILASAYTTGADYTAWIENTNRTPEELNDIVIGLIDQINSVVFTA